MGRAFVEEVFQGRDTIVVGNIGIEESDIIGRHDCVGRKRGGEGLYDIKYP